MSQVINAFNASTFYRNGIFPTRQSSLDALAEEELSVPLRTVGLALMLADSVCLNHGFYRLRYHSGPG